MNMSVTDLSVGCRFADYFAICGLDFDSGLETDRLSGKYYFVNESIDFINFKCKPKFKH